MLGVLTEYRQIHRASERYGNASLLVGAISKVVHLHIEGDGVVHFFKKCHAVLRHEGIIIEWIKLFHKRRRWKFFRIIVHKPASNVRVQAFRNLIEEILRNR